MFGAGMLLVFAGELFDTGTGAQLALAGVGGALLLAMTALRFSTMLRADPGERAVERSLLLLQLLVLIALVSRVVSDVHRPALVGLARLEYDQYHRARLRTQSTVGIVLLWAMVIAGTLIDRKRRPGGADLQ